MAELELYTYCKSSAAYRVRIALNFKQIKYTARYVDLLKDGGENFQSDYLNINPQGLIPTLIDGSHTIQQSIAILEYIEEKFPEPALLPEKSEDRAYCRAIAQIIACDIHPLNNLRVLAFIENDMQCSREEKLIWYRHWITQGFNAIEAYINKHNKNGIFCFGETLTIADVCLVPQVYNAYRYECDMTPYPIIRGIYEHSQLHDSVIMSLPEHQADFVR